MEAVMTLSCDLLIDLLSESNQQPRLSQQLMRNVFFIATDSFIQNSTSGTQGSRMVYLLRNLGAQINAQNEHGDTALMCYLKHDKPNCSIVEAFLRCNADIYIVNKQGEFPLEVVTTCPRLTGAVRDVFLRYVPGIWEAVARDDAVTIRRLINAWCRVDVHKNGKTLLQLAMEHGTENIIRVISSIRPSMEFAHCVLAGDTQMVRRVLRQKLKININFRNLGDQGKTPVFYALEQGNADMVHTLHDRGARLDITIKGDDEVDMPLFFAALEHHPAISSDLLKVVTPVAPVKIDALFYKGRNVLFHCIEKCVGEELVEFILSKSSAYLVTQRVELNRCPRELAEEAGCRWMVQAIDAAVVRWVNQEDSLNRQILTLQGYQYISSALKSNNHRESMPDTFYRYLPLYQEQVSAVHKAVEECDEETVRHIIYFRHPDDHSLDPCLADCRRPGDGQPLLHKAVLRGSVEVVQLLAETLVYQRKQRLDSIRDQFFRTALHYAYGLEDGRDLVNLLLDYGASEFSVDKDNRTPLAFKEKRGQDLMNALLEYHYLQDFSYQEPDVWSVESQMPIFDYLLGTSCSQSDGQPYITSQGLKRFTGHISSGHLSALPNTALTVPEALNQCTAFTMSHKYRSASDTTLHKITPSKQGLAANLANFPDFVKSRLTKKHNSKDNVQVAHKDYLPIPLDAPRESEDDYDYIDDITDSKDLLDEKEMRKSTSCSLQ